MTWSRTGRCGGGDDCGGCPVRVEFESDQGNVVVVVVVVATEECGRYDGRVV